MTEKIVDRDIKNQTKVCLWQLLVVPLTSHVYRPGTGTKLACRCWMIFNKCNQLYSFKVTVKSHTKVDVLYEPSEWPKLYRVFGHFESYRANKLIFSLIISQCSIVL